MYAYIYIYIYIFVCVYCVFVCFQSDMEGNVSSPLLERNLIVLYDLMLHLFILLVFNI